MNNNYFNEKLLELKSTSETKYKNISEIMIKCTEYENNLQNKINDLLSEINFLNKLELEINSLFDTICVEIMSDN